MAKHVPKKRHGNTVSVGDRVRIVKLTRRGLEDLSLDERQRLESMVGGIFTVYEIDKYGNPWVEQWWQEDKGRRTSHSIALLPEEMELVQAKNPKRSPSRRLKTALQRGRRESGD